MAARFLLGQKLDDDPWLPTAAGAAIEVHAQVMAARGERVEAVEYLREQLKHYAGTSLSERIGKNINLLTLEGKPAPALDPSRGRRVAQLERAARAPGAALFLGALVQRLQSRSRNPCPHSPEFEKRGLVILGPTRLYGYVAGGEEAPPARERVYIEAVRRNSTRRFPDAGPVERQQLYQLRRQFHPHAGADRPRGHRPLLPPRGRRRSRTHRENPPPFFEVYALWLSPLSASAVRFARIFPRTRSASIAERRSYRYSSSCRRLRGRRGGISLRGHSTHVPERLINNNSRVREKPNSFCG